MDRSVIRLALSAVAFAVVAGVSTARTQAQSSPGYLWLMHFQGDTVGTNDHVRLSGSFVNKCTIGLPSGSQLRIFFDQKVLLNVPITAALGQSQDFSSIVAVPQMGPPRNGVTAYRFAVVLPPAGDDMKTSPCLVTQVLGIPSN
jgi:hypothetical protein